IGCPPTSRRCRLWRWSRRGCGQRVDGAGPSHVTVPFTVSTSIPTAPGSWRSAALAWAAMAASSIAAITQAAVGLRPIRHGLRLVFQARPGFPGDGVLVFLCCVLLFAAGCTAPAQGAPGPAAGATWCFPADGVLVFLCCVLLFAAGCKAPGQCAHGQDAGAAGCLAGGGFQLVHMVTPLPGLQSGQQRTGGGSEGGEVFVGRRRQVPRPARKPRPTW